MSKVILRGEDVHKVYRLGRVMLEVLRGVSISVRQGEFVAIQGASGSGKSTLLHLLGALDIPTSGRVLLDDTDLFQMSAARRDRLRNKTFGFVFQFYHLLPELNVSENVLIGRMVGCSVIGWLRQRREARRSAHELLRLVGLDDRVRHRPNELSGGERQRVAIARALINRPRILLADEPTGNLDQKTGRAILDLLIGLNRERQTIVMVTHDSRVAEVAHRVYTLEDGEMKTESRRKMPSGEPATAK